MKLQTVTSTIGHSVFSLWNNGRKLITLGFNPASNAARVEFEDEKRVFLIRREGLLRNKTVLCNEYGIRIGHTGTENNRDFVVINNERYFYRFDKNNEPAVTFYKDSQQPLAVCQLELPANKAAESLRERSYRGLLMALCWYLFRPGQGAAALLTP